MPDNRITKESMDAHRRSVKKVISILGVVALCLARTQALAAEVQKDIPRDPETGRFQLQEVVPVDGVSAAELHRRAKAWAAVAYRSMKHVEQLDDKDAGRLILKGNFEVRISTLLQAYLTILHTLSIESKDGRYRCTMTDFATEQLPLEEWKGTKATKARIAAKAQLLLADLKASMSKKAEEW